MIILLSLSLPALAQEIKDIIRDPIVSRRCKNLLKERKEKIQVKQRLHSLLLRNGELQKKLKPTQKITKIRLDLNKVQISNNLRLSTIKVKAMEETIVRRGCPGITL